MSSNLFIDTGMEIIHAKDKNRFFLEENGIVAYVEYTIHEDVLDVIHTIVPPELSGRGIAALLVNHAYKIGRAHV